MGCGQVKCVTPNCTNVGKACTFVNGKCPSCYAKEIREQQEKLNALKPKQ